MFEINFENLNFSAILGYIGFPYWKNYYFWCDYSAEGWPKNCIWISGCHQGAPGIDSMTPPLTITGFLGPLCKYESENQWTFGPRIHVAGAIFHMWMMGSHLQMRKCHTTKGKDHSLEAIVCQMVSQSLNTNEFTLSPIIRELENSWKLSKSMFQATD